MDKANEKPDLEEVRRRVREVWRLSGPQLARAAAYVLDNPTAVAFETARGLSDKAGVGPATVIRLAKASGFNGYESFREVFRQSLKPVKIDYGARASAFQISQRELGDSAAIGEIARSSIANIETLFQPAVQKVIMQVAKRMVNARRVHVIGQRSCFSVAHYLSYVGRMAFSQFTQATTDSSGIDEVIRLGPDDLVVAIGFEHYSPEVVRGCRIAASQKVPLVAITDTPTSPLVKDAWRVFAVPMSGPQFLPSLVVYFALCEALLGEMIAIAGEPASKALADFEQKVTKTGGYLER